jgi:hypothetical protein
MVVALVAMMPSKNEMTFRSIFLMELTVTVKTQDNGQESRLKTTTPVEDWILHSSWHSQIGHDDNHSALAARRRSSVMTRVDPTSFETPVERIGVSGGTAPFFRLVWSEKGVRECQSRNDNDKTFPTRHIGLVRI